MLKQVVRRMLAAAVPNGSILRFRRGPLRGAAACIDWNYDLAVFAGYHEPTLHRHYLNLITPGMRCFDVGMYRGWDALLMTHLSGGKTVSFDGNSRCIEMAASFLAPSHYDIQLVRRYLTDGTNGGPTLDQAAREFFIPHFIKLDVEGAEVSVLQGATELLHRHRPSLIVEVHSELLEAECLALLEQCHYSSIVVDRNTGLLSESRSLDHNRWIVCQPIEPRVHAPRLHHGF